MSGFKLQIILNIFTHLVDYDANEASDGVFVVQQCKS